MRANFQPFSLCGSIPAKRTGSVKCGAKPAFTLLEVILALVILGAAMAIFGEVMQLANQNAIDSQAETQAQLLASSVMDEILAGVIDDSPANRQPLETGRRRPLDLLGEFGYLDHDGRVPSDCGGRARP